MKVVLLLLLFLVKLCPLSGLSPKVNSRKFNFPRQTKVCKSFFLCHLMLLYHLCPVSSNHHHQPTRNPQFPILACIFYMWVKNLLVGKSNMQAQPWSKFHAFSMGARKGEWKPTLQYVLRFLWPSSYQRHILFIVFIGEHRKCYRNLRLSEANKHTQARTAWTNSRTPEKAKIPALVDTISKWAVVDELHVFL